MDREAIISKNLCASLKSWRTITTGSAVLWNHVIASLAQRAAVPSMTSQVCLHVPPMPQASTHSGWRPSAGPWTRLISIYRLPLITPVGSVDQINIRNSVIQSCIYKLVYFFSTSLHLRRPESSAPRGRGTGAGGREPESAGFFRGTSYLFTTPGATGNREEKPGARNHSPGEGEEAARERK